MFVTGEIFGSDMAFLAEYEDYGGQSIGPTQVTIAGCGGYLSPDLILEIPGQGLISDARESVLSELHVDTF